MPLSPKAHSPSRAFNTSADVRCIVWLEEVVIVDVLLVEDAFDAFEQDVDLLLAQQVAIHGGFMTAPATKLDWIICQIWRQQGKKSLLISTQVVDACWTMQKIVDIRDLLI
eukprot:4545292-Amphidinium_carterae.2